MGASGPDAGEKRKSYLLELFKKFRRQNEDEIQEISVQQPVVEEEPAVMQEEPLPLPEETEKEEQEPEEEAAAIEFELPLEEKEEDSDAPAAASVKVLLDAKRMEAKVLVAPPEEGGAHVSLQQLRQALEAAGVVFGISDAMLNTVVRLKLYNKSCTVAKGQPAVNGVDGRLKNHFSQEVEARPNDRGDGTVDYKDLQLIRDIQKGTVITDIIPPVPMQPGSNILGKKLNGREGKAASVRVGRGTALSEDGTQLLADRPGNLVWKKDRFEIEETLHIAGSVDNAVGNVIFSGDVLIDEDVCEGYVVQSGRNVTVNGFVEGATIIAKGNVVIKKGMNGMGKGRIEAGGNINCPFFENSEVHCSGTVEADSLLNSDISAEDKIVLRGRRGAIMGGSCSACNLIDARSIGTESHIATEISLGASAEILAKHKELQEQVKKAEENIEMMDKDLSYLQRQAAAGKLAGERQNMLFQKNVERQKALDALEDLRWKADEMDELVNSARSGKLLVRTLYPPVRLTISGITQQILGEEYNASYYLFEGQIKRGTAV